MRWHSQLVPNAVRNRHEALAALGGSESFAIRTRETVSADSRYCISYITLDWYTLDIRQPVAARLRSALIGWSQGRCVELDEALRRCDCQGSRGPRNRDIEELRLGLSFIAEMGRIGDYHMVEFQPLQEQRR